MIPQLIFESLNSTGLALTEGDKIRNYILMGLSPEKQEAYYNGYWAKIEGCTGNDVSPFVRDYLSIKEQMTPTISNVYQAFKKYVETEKVSLDVLLEDMKKICPNLSETPFSGTAVWEMCSWMTAYTA